MIRGPARSVRHRVAQLLVLSLLSAFLALPARAEERPAETEFKGMELYSWQDANGGWVFALLPGTNRLKREAEVKQKENQIAGADELEKHFLQLAEREQVFWSHRAEGFVYPDEATREEIAASARKAKVELHGREDGKESLQDAAALYTSWTSGWGGLRQSPTA